VPARVETASTPAFNISASALPRAGTCAAASRRRRHTATLASSSAPSSAPAEPTRSGRAHARTRLPTRLTNDGWTYGLRSVSCIASATSSSFELFSAPLPALSPLAGSTFSAPCDGKCSPTEPVLTAEPRNFSASENWWTRGRELMRPLE